MSRQILIRNSAEHYGLVAIVLHWLVAAVFAANYAIIYWREWFTAPRTDEARALLSIHTALGVSVLVFVALRIIWRIVDRQPAPLPGRRLEHVAARGVHLLLYAAMIVLPLSGYLGAGGPTRLFFVVELPRFENTWLFERLIAGWLGLSGGAFEAVMDTIHKLGGAYVFSALIVAHTAAALSHHFVRRDVALTRMLFPTGRG